MRVLALVQGSFKHPLTHGGCFRSFHTCRCIGARHDLTIACIVPESNAKETRTTLLPICNRLKLFTHKRASELPLPITRQLTGLFRLIPEWRAREEAPNVCDWLSEQIASDNYDCIMVFAPAEKSFAELDTSRVILNVCDCMTLYYWRLFFEARSPRKSIARFLEYSMSRRYEKYYYCRFPRLVFISEVDAHFFSRISGRRHGIEIMPNGVDVGYFDQVQSMQQKPYSIVFSGNMGYLPNEDACLHFLDNIFPIILKQVPDANVCFVGSNPTDRLIRRAERYSKKQVEITGAVSDIRPYVYSAQAFVSPLRLGAGLKNKILEAWAMHRAVVATPISCDGLPAVHGENLLIGTSANELADHTIRLLRDSETRIKLSNSGYETVAREWSWEAKTVHYDKIMQGISKKDNVV